MFLLLYTVARHQPHCSSYHEPRQCSIHVFMALPEHCPITGDLDLEQPIMIT